MFARQLLLLALALTATLADAQAPPVTEKAVQSDRFVVGGSVRQEEPVGGDMIGFGGEVELAAPVRGDAVLAGGSVILRAPVGEDVYAAGGSVVVQGEIGGNARIAGGNAEIGSKGQVNGNLAIAGGDVAIRGPVKGDVKAAGGNVVIDAQVDGDVDVASGGLELGPNARIAGKLRYRGPDDIQRHPDALVGGGVERKVRGRHRHAVAHENSISFRGWFWTIGLIGLAAILAAAFPAVSKRASDEMRANPGLVFLFGFIALVCLPVFAALLMITIIGIPLALVVVLLYFVLLLVGYAAVAVMLGEAVLERYKAEAASLLGWRVGAAMLAMLVLALLGRLPFIGGLIVFAALLAGIGAIVISLRPRTTAAA